MIGCYSFATESPILSPIFTFVFDKQAFSAQKDTSIHLAAEAITTIEVSYYHYKKILLFSLVLTRKEPFESFALQALQVARPDLATSK
jgi:hypothetical protein